MIRIDIKEKKFNEILFKNVNLEIKKSGFYLLYGKSGSGKSTFLNILAGIDTNFEGKVLYNIDYEFIIDYKTEKKDLLYFRRKNIGYIFQDFSLIEELNVYDNIRFPLILLKKKNFEIIEKILKRLKIYELKYKKMNQISGGQKQRVAIGRAIVHSPKIILADEPTANLDKETKLEVINLFKENLKDKIVIIVTHDYELIELLEVAKIFKIENKSIIEVNGF